jgi:hypothetical protein
VVARNPGDRRPHASSLVPLFPAARAQWYYDGRLIYTIDRQSDPGAPLPVPDNMMVVMNTALAWWLQPSGQAPGIGDGYTFHYIGKRGVAVRVWAQCGAFRRRGAHPVTPASQCVCPPPPPRPPAHADYIRLWTRV